MREGLGLGRLFFFFEAVAFAGVEEDDDENGQIQLIQVLVVAFPVAAF